MIQKILVILLLTFVNACSSPKDGVEKKPTNQAGKLETACELHVNVVDYTGLDGCGLLLIDQSGQKLLPMEFPKNIQWKAGEQYSISFSEITDALSVCMAESQIIRVNCAEKITVRCAPSETGLDNEMLKKRIDNGGVLRIIRYNYEQSWVYRINTIQQTELINCQGVSLCPNASDMFADCFSNFKSNLSQQKIIYQGEGPQD